MPACGRVAVGPRPSTSAHSRRVSEGIGSPAIRTGFSGRMVNARAIAAKGKASSRVSDGGTWKERAGGRGGAIQTASVVRLPDESWEAAHSRDRRRRRASRRSWPRVSAGASDGSLPVFDGYEFRTGTCRPGHQSQSARFAILISEWAGPANDVLPERPARTDAHELAQLASAHHIDASSHQRRGDERSVEVHLRTAHHKPTVCSCSHARRLKDRLPRAGLRAGDGAARLLLQDDAMEGDDSQAFFACETSQRDAAIRVRGR